MSSFNHRISRRAFAAGAIATAAGASSVAAQTITAGSPLGPFFPTGYRGETDADLTRIAGQAERAAGQVIEVMGRVLDRYGNPVSGARLDIWQANAFGKYAHPQDTSDRPLDPNFQGFATIHTGKDGGWKLTTIKPGLYSAGFGQRTPHIHMDVNGVSSRSILQMYFPEEVEANREDALFKDLGDRAPTSIASVLGDHRYGWDIVLIEG